MRRDSGRRKEVQKAEYRNRKKGMETGRTEEERSTGGTAARGEREEGKRKSRRLSSQKQAEADERKRKASRKPGKKAIDKKAEKKGSTGGTAVGAKPGRTKGNEQKAEYENRERMHGKPGREERGKPGKRERNRSTGEATVRRKREGSGKEEAEAK